MELNKLRIYCQNKSEFDKVCRLLKVDLGYEIDNETNPILIFEQSGYINHCGGTKQFCKNCQLCNGVKYKDINASEILIKNRIIKLNKIING